MEFFKRTVLPTASAGAGLGFEIGRRSTSLGIGIAKFFTTGAITASSAMVDYALGFSTPSSGLLSGPTVSLASSLNLLLFDGIETLAIGGINLGEALTSQSFIAVGAVADTISSLYQGSGYVEEGNEAVFSLMAFVKLVKREMEVDEERDKGMPEYAKSVGIVGLARALAGWAAIQSMTVEYTDRNILDSLELIRLKDWKAGPETYDDKKEKKMVKNDVEPKDLEVSIISHEDIPESAAEIISAEVGHVEKGVDGGGDDSMMTSTTTTRVASPVPPSTPMVDSSSKASSPPRTSYYKDRTYLRRMSKIVLGAYGGPGMIFFGGPRPPNLGQATGSSRDNRHRDLSSTEKQDHLLSDSVISAEPTAVKPGRAQQMGTWWDTVRGRNDKLIFEHYAGLGEGLVGDSSASAPSVSNTDESIKMMEEEMKSELKQGEQGQQKASLQSSVTAGDDPTLPRFWVLTDHNRHEIVLALRGTMSLNELAIDLACDSRDFVLPGNDQEKARVDDESVEGPAGNGGQGKKISGRETSEGHKVHSGFWRIAKAMGGKGKPVQRAVGSALRRNKGYSLIIAGHSLGAGVAAILALMWADPTTCLTLKSSGMPANRQVHAYCLACPCILSAKLCKTSENLITTLIYSYDFVARLSLGSIRDLKRIATWLAYAMGDKNVGLQENCSNVVSRAVKYRAGIGGEGARSKEKDWFLALRKTLEAQHEDVELFPAGRVYHVFEKGDFMDESLKTFLDRRKLSGDEDDMDDGEEGMGLRLFRVKDVQKDFSQIVFSSKMLSCHLPHNYDRILGEQL